LDPTSKVAGLKDSIGLELLAPHRSYFDLIYPLIHHNIIKGLAHLTGGGFIDNIPRILPEGCGVTIQKGSWPVLPIFEFLQKSGDVTDDEAYRVFNMGIGMIAVLAPEDVTQFQAVIPECYRIGEIIAGDKQVILK
jgi:phosphoribosylformylglycinamidine cyclo-ligase